MRKRILLSSIYKPFCTDDPFDSPFNQVQHGTCHRQFTREQGIFTIHQQCSHLALHLIAANVDADVDVVEYPSLDEFVDFLGDAARSGKPYDYVGITTTASYMRKARLMCERAKSVSPTTQTIVGGGGALAVGEIIEPFSDHVCRGDGVRFFRELLGQNVEAPIDHPVVLSIHHPNQIIGCKANPNSFSLAVSLGCPRRCEFCSTSAQFDGKHIPILATGEQLFGAMKKVEKDLRSRRSRVPYIYFVIFDENFLTNDKLVEEFLKLNREQLGAGTMYLPFIFADAKNVSRFPVETLLELGIDALWIGMETSVEGKFDKTAGIDFRNLIETLKTNGLKVFISFMAGLEEQTKASIEQDIEFALTLGASGYQYAMVAPMPGTEFFKRLRAKGMLDLTRPEKINMSHYYVLHDQFDEDYIRCKTIEFQRRDYERHGPLALRYMQTRLDGYVRHRNSPNPTLRARARGFRNDLMDASGILSAGPSLAPNPEVAEMFRATHRRLRKEVKLLPAILDIFQDQATPAGVLQFFVFTNRLLEPLLRIVLLIRAIKSDPRSAPSCRTFLGLLLHYKSALILIRHGMMPWDQPRLVVTKYPRNGDNGFAYSIQRPVLQRIAAIWTRLGLNRNEA